MVISNELQPSAFLSNPEILVRLSSSRLIELKSQTSPDIKFVVHKPGKTVIRSKSNTLMVVALPRGRIGDWSLKSAILLQIRRTGKECLATTWLEGIVEYGVGKGEGEAITDLVVSLGEYRESLTRREACLGDSARKELDYLRRLIERSPDNST